ncbi:DUF3800 domain-containing protein [Pseudoalteromonas shioyasakiensis]|uniref:DUF3800 domain-containing protein n=1 Tax=Pseudoalteromonas shioyasakiensis TaxID=1190813 RepID=A0ABT6TZQ8_9GAMM|nr:MULTISPECIES: DUF3800 domain-containing protein [Pseudoalteromonas]MDI4669399.1 DUF3800 domain-containing protein [Pseudoalteromonas shioyasakiensis]MDI4673408.1 DUF3800 domain-containing protein [Pseudoalteromonas shioyasakiensis]MDI4685905.1 DUF3800 domain-containing protein [Pseudoalteromonas shioyasakiensis]MDI4704195.1 DUF3800 domain-containing protein [Pseudoalteromonas shioyasakiensis]NUJ23502.1 DUF3800 domain-containing protein [Pseudoalteromonas sp. 0802]
MENMDEGKLIWHIACDESGVDGQVYYGFGSLWMKYQRRGDFARIIRQLREKHNYHYEIKWQRAHKKSYSAFYKELTEIFFKHAWLAFHCIIVRKGMVDKTFHNGDYDLAMRKHFTKLISTKIKTVIKAHPNRNCEFRIEVDPLPSRYKKADEAFHKIANSTLKKEDFKIYEPIKSVITKDSKESEQIQLADFLLGAVMSAFQGKVTSEAKKAIADNVASYLGWETLKHDTWHTERKFNIWYFFDPRYTNREISTQNVVLKYPLPSKSIK